MKKIIISSVLVIAVVAILVNLDTVYLKLQESKVSDADYYVSEINAERARKEQSKINRTDLKFYTKYSGNSIYVTQVYVEDKIEMIFLTRAFKNGFLDWEYHTLPFTTTENIIDESLDEWILN
ncbi:hypothetical protein [Sporosarcina aquimarina]|uniref:DUF3139 domain-containing protein n=1 Tax=Sporosarcina aquimarina TaxID=114975 RepID=A0ABU4FYE2_9BACL|nr:hypothetical protein [Sporosarcina aquimarina]MDW0109740.1 hypothetical protein [Sporosarcina aquimarina]